LTRARHDEGGALGTGRRAAVALLPALRAGASALLGLAAACTRAPSAPAPAHAAAPHVVTYALDWAADDAGATSRDADGSFTVTSDLGYTIRVTRGWFTSYGVELVECPRDAAPAPLAHAAGLVWSALEGTAWAGHSSDTPNPAAAHPMQVESLVAPESHDVAKIELAPQAYCKLHYLLARAGADARDLPREPDMVGTSLHVEGTWRAPGSVSAVPFTLHTASAYGALVEHANGDARPLRVDTGDGDARITVRRDRAHMFDGVDLAHVPERTAALQVLRALVEHVEVRVAQAGDGSAS
jgi:hypothetical protein